MLAWEMRVASKMPRLKSLKHNSLTEENMLCWSFWNTKVIIKMNGYYYFPELFCTLLLPNIRHLLLTTKTHTDTQNQRLFITFINRATAAIFPVAITSFYFSGFCRFWVFEQMEWKRCFIHLLFFIVHKLNSNPGCKHLLQ